MGPEGSSKTFTEILSVRYNQQEVGTSERSLADDVNKYYEKKMLNICTKIEN